MSQPPSQPQAANAAGPLRQAAALLLLALVVAATLGFNFADQGWLNWLACGALAGYLVVVADRLNGTSRAFVVLALAASAVMVLLGRDLVAVLYEGGAKACLFASFLGAIGMLRQAAEGSSLVARVGDLLIRVRPLWRYPLLCGGGQLLSGFLAAGALNILCTAVYRGNDRIGHSQGAALQQLRQRRMITALLRGHCMAQCWAPTSLFVVLLLALIPELQPSRLLPYSAGMALLALGLGWGLDQLGSRRLAVSAVARSALLEFQADKPPLWPLVLPLLLLFSTLCGLTFGLARWLDINFVQALVIAFPLFAMGWTLLQCPGDAAPQGARQRLGRLWLEGFPGQGNEIALMGSSVFLGVLVARQIDPGAILALIDAGGLAPAILVSLCAWSIPLLGLLGVNPTVSVTILASLSDALVTAGIPLLPFAVTILGAWCISAGVSPIAQPVLIVARSIRRHAGVVGPRWNGLYSLVAMLALTLWVWLVLT
ncbi:hypothetical protein [Marinobacterium rhizophilum]|uniref:Di/tricarboxylate transporter n=1 Tax=Marinobacterium rhizophilum TaxID=420402 RepID=A0ABY5HKE4_9GAMM|nr:hypothetical protein [Marinobacterium rhizophilum]UTW12594.1 hypothetical protein KDW95_02600 [Marinobacterium rhizophilum]